LGEASSASASGSPPPLKKEDEYPEYTHLESGGFGKFFNILLGLGVIGIVGAGVKKVW
tara:strand:+ start:3227 stop:3400 length:174 start_codon:yes stop_codon:yes gene_type:complete